MLTNKQMIIIGVFALAITALILGCELDDIVRLLPVMLGLGG
jgi:hypothetical protein